MKTKLLYDLFNNKNKNNKYYYWSILLNEYVIIDIIIYLFLGHFVKNFMRLFIISEQLYHYRTRILKSWSVLN